MQRFQDSQQAITIVDGGNFFTCAVSQFVGYEDTYQPLPASQARVWTPEVQYLTEGGNQRADAFYTPERFARYVAQIATYQALLEADNTPTPIPFAAQQASALAAWNQQVNAFITQYFDTGTQISFVKLYIQSEAARPVIAQVDAWVSAVMGYYYFVKTQLQAATAITELESLHVVMEFDSRFGQQGSLVSVPDVHLSQFF